MARSIAAPSPIWIQNPKVTLEQTVVYRNGLQQATLVLYLEAISDDEYIPLTSEEVASIRVITYDRRPGQDEEDLIPFNDDGPAVSFRGWSAQRKYLGYEFQHGSDRGSDRIAKADRGEQFVFYCSAADDGREFIDIAFSIKTRDGAIFRTSGWITQGDVREYESNMDVKSGIRLTPQAPLVYSSSDFLLDRTPLDDGASPPEGKLAAIFDDIVRLSIKASDGRTVGIRSMSCEPAGVIHWIDKLPSTQNPCFTGYVAPGETEVHWNDAVHYGSHPLPTLASPEYDKGVIFLCGRNDIAPYANAPDGPFKVSLVDANGSSQTCHIRFVAGSRDELEVT